MEHSIWFAPVPSREPKKEAWEGPGISLEECYGWVSYNALNVAITRAQYGASVFTNLIADLAREVERDEDVESSTVKPVSGVREKPAAALSVPLPEAGSPGRTRDAESYPREATVKHGRDGRVMLEAKERETVLRPERELAAGREIPGRKKPVSEVTRTIFDVERRSENAWTNLPGRERR